MGAVAAARSASAGERDAAPRADLLARARSFPPRSLLHAWMAGREFATPEGLDLSLAERGVGRRRAGRARRLGVGPAANAAGDRQPSCCRSPRSRSLLPALVANPHRFPYADEPWAALHIAVALVSYALFLVAALQALLLMGLEKRLRRRAAGSGRHAARRRC